MRPCARGADFGGLVFIPARRAISRWTRRAPWPSACAGRLRLVALFADADDAAIAAAIAAVQPDFLQLHGNESAGTRRRRRAPASACPVIKALAIAEAADLAARPRL